MYVNRRTHVKQIYFHSYHANAHVISPTRILVTCESMGYLNNGIIYCLSLLSYYISNGVSIVNTGDNV